MNGLGSWQEAPEIAVAHFLAEHDGVITTRQAQACGFDRGDIRWRVDRGLWLRQAQGVFLSLEHPLSEAARIRIVEASYAAVIDRTAAIWWHGLSREPLGPITASIPRSVSPTKVCRVPALLKRRGLPAEDLTTVRDVRVTGLPFSVLSAVSMMDEPIVFLDRVIQTGAVSIEAMKRCLERNRGIHGMREARRLLGLSDDGSESEAERLFARALRREQIAGWVQQLPFNGFRIDFAWPDERISVEIHGFSFHRYEDRFDTDLVKANALAGEGWLPLAFSWKRLNRDLEGCMRELISALEMRRSLMW